VDYLRTVLPPENIVHHCANESHIGGRKAMLATVKKKQMGQVTGFPDLLVLTFQGAVFFEVKAEGNYATQAQKDVHAAIKRLGGKVGIVRSVDDVREYLQLWGIGFCESVPVRGVIE